MPSKKSDARSSFSELPWTSLLDSESEISSSRSNPEIPTTEKKTVAPRRKGSFLRLGADRFARSGQQKKQSS